jgi:hypothetical protein
MSNWMPPMPSTLARHRPNLDRSACLLPLVACTVQQAGM